MTSIMTGWSMYFASFSMALKTLKVVDKALVRVEMILKTAELDTAKTEGGYVKIILASSLIMGMEG